MESLPPLSFWLVPIVLPMVVVTGNAIVRLTLKLPLSATADIVLALILFDIVVVIQSIDFQQFIKNDEFRRNIVGIYGIMIFIGRCYGFFLCSWLKRRFPIIGIIRKCHLVTHPAAR